MIRMLPSTRQALAKAMEGTSVGKCQGSKSYGCKSLQTLSVCLTNILTVFTGVIEKKWTRVVARLMWRDVPWYQQVSRSVKEFEWEGHDVDRNFVNLVVCEWEPIKDEDFLTGYI